MSVLSQGFKRVDSLLFLLIISWGCVSSVEEKKQENQTDEPQEEVLFLLSFEDYSPFFQQLVGRDSLGFRGSHLGDTYSDVRATEVARFEELDSLTARFELEDGIVNNAEIEYQFSEDSILTAIEMNIFCSRQGCRDSLFDALMLYYGGIYSFQQTDSQFEWEDKGAVFQIKKEGVPEYPNISWTVSNK